MGNEVIYNCYYDFGGTKPKLESKEKDRIQKYNPDLIILFNNVGCEIVYNFECPILIYEVDTPLYYANTNLIKKNPNKYKFCIVQEESRPILENEYGVKKENIFHLPFFTEIQNEKIERKENICFIGTKFLTPNKSIITRFMETNPSRGEIELWRMCVKAIEKNPFLTSEEIIKNLTITSTKVSTYFKTDELITSLSNINRISTLSAVADLGLQLYGNRAWLTDLPHEPEITLSYRNKHVYSIKDNQDIYNSSKIGININHIQAISSFSWRVCDIMASGACLVSNYTPGLQERFPNIPIPVFTNKYEARDICIDLLNNENKRLDIVSMCNEVIDEGYRFKHIVSRLEYYLDVSLTNQDKKEESACNITNYNKKKNYMKEIKRRTKNIAIGTLFVLSNIPFLTPLFKKKILKKINAYLRRIA